MARLFWVGTGVALTVEVVGVLGNLQNLHGVLLGEA